MLHLRQVQQVLQWPQTYPGQQQAIRVGVRLLPQEQEMVLSLLLIRPMQDPVQEQQQLLFPDQE